MFQMEVNQPKSGYYNNIIYNVIWIKPDSQFKIKINKICPPNPL